MIRYRFRPHIVDGAVTVRSDRSDEGCDSNGVAQPSSRETADGPGGDSTLLTDTVKLTDSLNLTDSVSLDLSPGEEWRHIQIDAGKCFREQVLRWFVRCKIPTIDALILTHEHADAILGLDDVRGLQRIPRHAADHVEPLSVFLSRRCMARCEQHRCMARIYVPVFSRLMTFMSFVTPLPVQHGEDYIALGFEFGSHERVVYMSDVSRIPDTTLAYLKARQQLLGRIHILVIDSLYFDHPHATHFHLPQTLDAIRSLRPNNAFIVGMTHEFDHHKPAALRCDADSAFLCATCDAAVHSANFIVLRHSRHLLCALCSSPTSWEAPSPFHQPAAAAQTQVLCDSCLAVGAVSGITGNAVFHTPCAMSASMAASLLPLHTYAAALSSSAFVPSPPLNVAPESQSLAKRHKANMEDLLAFSRYPPHAKLSQMQSQQQQLPSLLLAGATLSQNSLGTANQGQHHCPLSSSSSSSSPPETLQLFPTATPSEGATESAVVTPSLTNGTLSQQQPALAHACAVADAAGVVPDLNESLCNENQTVPDAATGKRQRQEEQVAGETQNVLGGSCADGQGRNVLGQLAAARLKRVLSSWYARLALRGPHVSDLAFHIFQKVLRKLQPGRVAADSLRVTLAACMWTAAKLDDNQKTLPRASDVAAVARAPAKRLQAAELEVMKLVDWRPLEGFTGFQE
ncbi:unnamed protein product [Closterium sp. NIES-65]|nr:unnamed protein product [Closterium sp. NIES-65]